MNNIINKYFNGIDIIYWINLDRVKDRRNNMTSILSNFPVPNIRVSAIDGKNDSDDNIYGKFIGSNSKYKKTEYACLLSHLNTLKQFSNSKYDIALILEDDICLDFVKYWNKSIQTIINEAPSNWDIIMLHYSDQNNIINDTYFLRKPGDKIWSTLSYLINKKSTNKLIDKIFINNKYVLDNSLHTADDFIFNNMNTYIYKYAYFIYPDENTSTIRTHNISFVNDMKLNLDTIWKKYYSKEKMTNINPHTKINCIGANQHIIYNIIIYLVLIIIFFYIIIKLYIII